MGYRELLLVMLSLVMLSTLMLQINTAAVEGREALQTLEIEQMAVAVAQQFIEEAKTKKFDAVLEWLNPSDDDDFTDEDNLGANPITEVYPNFNDVDDYHNFSDSVYVNGIDFFVDIDVHYVQSSNWDSPHNDQTYHKRMTVTVTSSWLPNAVTLKHVFTFFGLKM